MPHYGADIAGQKMLTLADPKHKWTASTRPDDQPRKLCMDDRDPVGAGHQSQGLTGRVDKRALSSFRGAVKGPTDQMSQNFGVGLGKKLIPHLLKLRAE